MKPIFGFILIGGGLVLVIGTLMGKIQFPLQAPTSSGQTNTGNTTQPPTTGYGTGGSTFRS